MKDLGSSSKTKSSASNIGLNINDEIIFDKSKVAHQFNTFVTTVASNLVQKLSMATGRFGSLIVEQFYVDKCVSPNSFSLNPVTIDNVYKMLKGLNSTKATGLDNIPARFVNDAADNISTPLTHMIHLSLHHGKVPDDLKYARVVPLYKKTSKTDVGNYRPVSILNVISKVFERVVHDQLYDYLQDSSLLYMYQSGFRK